MPITNVDIGESVQNPERKVFLAAMSVYHSYMVKLVRGQVKGKKIQLHQSDNVCTIGRLQLQRGSYVPVLGPHPTEDAIYEGVAL